ncbi:MAG: hypothetical protein EAZ95_10040 [Bacteroidetes bacterium]|nr:MAG: hypothetical protein EAZ95_10040 [Bacteroidota bacterium]
MASVRIYCEGTEKSYDVAILKKVKEGLATDSILITPIAGKGGGRAVMQFAENQIKKGVSSKDTFYFFFRDRDFDVPVPLVESLTIQTNSFFTYRTTIENYLFDAKLFCDFINEDATRQKKYPHIKTEQDAKQIFIDTAKKISHYQAIRHTLGKMRVAIDIGTTWTSGSGNLPADLSEEACRQEAISKIQQEIAKVNVWTEADFDQILGAFLAKFDDAFFNNLEFLVYFQGKDFAKALTKFILPQFDIGAYYTYALEKFDYTKFDDLVELRNIIEKKIA